MSDLLETIQQYSLGDETDDIILSSQNEQAKAVFQLASKASLQLNILSYELDKHLYDQDDFVDACKTLVLRNQRCHIKILIQSNENLRRLDHRLIALMQRLPSRIDLKITDKEQKDFPETFLLADSYGIYLKRSPGRTNAIVNFKAPLQVKKYSQLFNKIWDKAHLDSSLRRLSL